MADNIGLSPEDFCPECNLHIPTYFKEQEKIKLFEQKYGEVLKAPRAFVRPCGRLISMALCVSISLFFLKVNVFNAGLSLTLVFSGKLGYILPVLIIFICSMLGVGGFFLQEPTCLNLRKKLWKLFEQEN